jgi:molybdenum cofactor cytidylyltransferase
MGQSKMVLAWRSGRTVIEQVVRTLLDSGIDPVVVVLGARPELVKEALVGLPVQFTFNQRFADAEMLTSLQVGLRQFGSETDGVLVTLGDQPTIEVKVVKAVVNAFSCSSSQLVVPSYQMRRGHPWLLARSLWPELLSVPADRSMRDFLNAHAEEILYIPVDSEGILKDMDTPEDYQALMNEDVPQD